MTFRGWGTLLFYLLKLDVFKSCILEGSGLDFGGSGPRFGRLRASILEAPGLDFRASRPTCSGKTLFPQVSCLKRLPPSFSSFPNCMAVLQHSCYQRGRRRWSPLGGFNPPPTEGVRSVLDIQPHRFQIRPDQITKGESERPSSLCKPRLLFPSLFLSPGGWGQPESATKFAHSASCWVSWADFLLF